MSLTSCPVEVYCFEFDHSEQFELTYRESIVLGSPACILRSRAHLKQTLNTQQCEQHAINYFQIIIIKAPMVLTQTSHCAASIASAVLIVSLAVSEGFFIVARLRTKSSLLSTATRVAQHRLRLALDFDWPVQKMASYVRDRQTCCLVFSSPPVSLGQ